MNMKDFSYTFTMSADNVDDDDGKMKVHVKYDDAKGIGVDMNREFDMDSYQDGVSSMLEDLETQILHASMAKYMQDSLEKEPQTASADIDVDKLYSALDRLQSKLDMLERKLSVIETRNDDAFPDPRDVRNPYSPFGKIWC